MAYTMNPGGGTTRLSSQGTRITHNIGGRPGSSGAASNAFDLGIAERRAQAAVAAAQAEAAGVASAGRSAGMGTAEAGRFGGLGTAEAGRYGGLGQLAGAMAMDNANRYGAYATAEGNRQTAMANEAMGRYSSNAMAEAARQTTLGNLGSAALGAYGSNANQAMQAFALQQQAYNQALAQMQGANQAALASYGGSRNSALAGLAGADAIGGMDGGQFAAAGPQGDVASGTYSGGGGRANLDRYGRYLMDDGILDRLTAGAERDLAALNEQNTAARGMPSQMQGQTFADLLAMGDQYISPVNQGMDQYYGNMQDRPDFAGGMNQFYDNMAGQPDYSGVLAALSTPTPGFDQQSRFGGSATLAGLFGSQAVGSRDLNRMTPYVQSQMTQLGRMNDQLAAQNAYAAEMRRRATT